MEKTYSWSEPGREKLDLILEIEGQDILKVKMKCVGCLDFLNLSQTMRSQLVGPVNKLVPPSGIDHSSMIWREVISSILEEWQLPFPHEELCHCRKITTQKVDRAIVYGAHTLAEIRQRTSANTGCGTCKNDVAQMISYRLKTE